MTSPRQHIPVWKRLLLALGILFIVIISMIGHNVYQLVHTKIPESYAAWTTGSLIIGYLETHANQWPSSWDDLQSATNFNQPSSVFFTIDRLRQTVKIDWQVDVGRLQQIVRSNSNATIHIVTRLDGLPLQAVWGADTEPNAKIMSYLRATLATTNTETDHKSPSPK
jgi:hypothetical protein